MQRGAQREGLRQNGSKCNGYLKLQHRTKETERVYLKLQQRTNGNNYELVYNNQRSTYLLTTNYVLTTTGSHKGSL